MIIEKRKPDLLGGDGTPILSFPNCKNKREEVKEFDMDRKRGPPQARTTTNSHDLPDQVGSERERRGRQSGVLFI